MLLYITFIINADDTWDEFDEYSYSEARTRAAQAKKAGAKFIAIRAKRDPFSDVSVQIYKYGQEDGE